MKQSVLLLASIALAVLLACGVAWAAEIQCARSFGEDPCEGTEEPDTIYGTDRTDRKDWIVGKQGGDLIFGLRGPDWINGEEAPDTIYGAKGRDDLHGWAGDDKLYGGDGDDFLHGRNGNDRLSGGRGPDRLEGDQLSGRAAGDDRVFGGGGDDRFYVYNDPQQRDLVRCGDGNDTVWADLADKVASDCENVEYV